MRLRRGPGIPTPDLLPLATVASELTLRATAYETGGGPGVRSADRWWLGGLARSSNKTNHTPAEKNVGRARAAATTRAWHRLASRTRAFAFAEA